LNKPLIKQCQSWDDCLQLLEQSTADTGRYKDQADLQMALLPAVSIAWYIKNHFSELMDRKHLDIWIIGAELIDGRDAGYWYHVLSKLTGIDHIKVRLIGPNIPKGADDDSIFRGSLEDLLAQSDSQLPDVAVVFQPGFEEEDGLLSSGAIAQLLSSNCKVLGSSYSEEEFQRDRLICEAYDYRLPEDTENPYALDPATTGLRWAERMWHFDNAFAPSLETLKNPDLQLIEMVKCLSRMTAHSRLHGNWVQPAPPGSAFQIPDTRGGVRVMVHIMDSYYLDPAAGALYGVEEGKLRPCDIAVSYEDIQSMPANGTPMDLALWASQIKSKYLVTGKKPTH
jgi:hypothetical protein